MTSFWGIPSSQGCYQSLLPSQALNKVINSDNSLVKGVVSQSESWKRGCVCEKNNKVFTHANVTLKLWHTSFGKN